MDSETLTELLRGRHFNMEERAARGAWPHPPLSYNEVLRHLAKVLGEGDWFPGPLPKPRPGWAGDYVVIERRGPREYLAHFLSSGALGQIAEKGEHKFTTPEKAAGYYLRWALGLPGDLDGWKVIA